MSEMLTKWSVLTAKRDRLKAELADIEGQLAWMEKTPLGIGCTGCGQHLATERDFAEHFVISKFYAESGLLNLGYCPVPSCRVVRCDYTGTAHMGAYPHPESDDCINARRA